MRLALVGLFVSAWLVAESPHTGALPNHRGARDVGDSTNVRDLPLVEVPATIDGHTLAILLSGDGGWASIDRQIADELALHGVSVIGFNLKEYLGRERTPDETAVAVGRAIRAYRLRWHRDSVVILGFSRGANIAPFVVNRLANDLRATVTLIALVSPARAANFKWHWQDVFRDIKRPSDIPVRPELDRVKAVRVICIFGVDDTESGCRDTPQEVRRVERRGGHHMDGNYRAVADVVLDALAP